MTTETGFQLQNNSEFDHHPNGARLPTDLEPSNFSEMIGALTAVGVSLGVAMRTIDRLGDTRLDRVSELLSRTLDQYWRASRAFPRVPHVPEVLTWGQTQGAAGMPRRTPQDGAGND